MTFTAGTLSLVSAASTSLSLASTAATGGTGPYTEAWYISTVSGFTPGVGNIVSGASGLAATITGLIPGTQYYVKVVYTDTGASNVTVTSAQFAAATQTQTQSPNQFQQAPQLGMLDLKFDPDTVSVLIDVSQATPLYAGSAVKIVDSADGVPKVVGCAANSDNVFGFIIFDIKTVAFLAGNAAEISLSQNVQYLYATTAIARGAQVSLDLSTIGGVSTITTGANVVGFAYDKAPAAGALIRVKLSTPSFLTAP
jgi:hypothetical protein